MAPGHHIQYGAVITTVNFFHKYHKRHPIACPLGRGMGCQLWIQHLIDILPQFLQLFMLTILVRVIMALDCNYINPGYGLSLVDTLWNASSYRQPLEQEPRGQSNDLNREILASNLFNCRKGVINAPPVPSISRCIHIVYRHKNIWEYQWSNFIYNCMRTFLHYVHCKDALLDCSAPGGERCESLTWVDEIDQCMWNNPEGYGQINDIDSLRTII